MSYWADFGVSEERRRELMREAEEARVARGVARGGSVELAEGVEVRWALREDEAKIADLLELNGLPRWTAFEDRYIVVEEDGKIVAAARYRTSSKRLVLGLLVVDPWAGERRLSVALYAGARALAAELGAREVLVEHVPDDDYLHEAGYRYVLGRGWRLDATRPAEGRRALPAGGWRRMLALLGHVTPPFFRAFPR